MDPKFPSKEALHRASNQKPEKPNVKTLLVHPFSSKINTNQEKKSTKTYLLETPKNIKRKAPLLEIPKHYNTKPKRYNFDNLIENNQNVEPIPTKSEINKESDKSNCCAAHHCCCMSNCKNNTETKKPNDDIEKMKESDNCDCKNSVKFILAPAMMPPMNIFTPYMIKTGKTEKVSPIFAKINQTKCT